MTAIGGLLTLSATAAIAARPTLEPLVPPQLAVDLLIAKIPIEMGRQGRAERAASGGRDP